MRSSRVWLFVLFLLTAACAVEVVGARDTDGTASRVDARTTHPQSTLDGDGDAVPPGPEANDRSLPSPGPGDGSLPPPVADTSSAVTIDAAGSGANCDDVQLGPNADLGDHLPFASSAWNTPIDTLAVHPSSAELIAASGPEAGLHADFGNGLYKGSKIGIPYVVVPENQPLVPINLTTYPEVADRGPYPIPPSAPIEGYGAPSADYSDNHVIVVQRDSSSPNCLGKLYELFRAVPNGNYPLSVSSWSGYGCVFDMRRGDRQRPEGWSSADAAGLPIFPGLLRYDEVRRAIERHGDQGVVAHAIRFTVSAGFTAWKKIAPAQHCAGWNAGKIPFGWRVRLRSSFQPAADWPIEVKVIVNTLKRYGLIMADNAGPWFLGGSPDERWNNDRLRYLGYVKGRDFEMVNTGPIEACTP